jgi:hypothetical protein
MEYKTLRQAVSEHPYPDYAAWWPMGTDFLRFMAEAIGTEWLDLAARSTGLAEVQAYVAGYISAVYGRDAGPGLATDFADIRNLETIRSGEFDALSYAFFRSAYDALANRWDDIPHAPSRSCSRMPAVRPTRRRTSIRRVIRRTG